MSRKYQCGFGMATVACLMGAGAAQAQGSTSSLLEEIVVTAQKRVEKLQDVPIAITVVGENQLAQQNIYSVTDLARAVPALEMIQGFGGPGGGGQVRGIATLSFAPTAEAAVGIVTDGVPQGRVNSSSIFDMQRVEVLRGPQGTLFGLTTSAGVINMTTQAPKIGVFETSVHVDYSGTDKAGSEFGRNTVNGAMNIPINESQALRVAVQSDRTEDVQFNEFNDQGSEVNQYSGRVRYVLKPSEDFEMNLIGDFSKEDSSNGGGAAFTYVSANPAQTARLAACGITPSYDNRERCSSHTVQDTSKVFGGSAQFDIGLGESTLTSITSYRKSEAGPTFQDFQGLSSDNPQIFQMGSTGTQRQITQEVRLLSPSSQSVEYVAGLFYSGYKSTSDNGGNTGGGTKVIVTIPFPPFLIFAVPPSYTTSEITNKSSAAFGELTFHATDALSLITGLRFTHQEIESRGSGNQLLAVPLPTYGEVSEDNVSGRVGMRYQFGPNLTGYATATRGYKGPQVTAATDGNQASILAAEIPTAYEVGIKGALFDGKLGMDANVFYTEVKHFQGQRCGINSVGFLFCPPDSVPSIKSKGVELGLYGSPVQDLTLNGGFIYNIAEYPSGYTGFNPDDLRDQILTGPLAGQGTTNLGELQLVNVPKTKFTLSGDYSRALGSVMGFLALDTVYKSEIRFGPSADPRFVYPAHWTHGARLGVRSADDKWSVGLFGRNLTAEREPNTIFGGPSFAGPVAAAPPGSVANRGFINGVSQIMGPSQLRQIGLSVDVKF